jgi:hypothetical protein
MFNLNNNNMSGSIESITIYMVKLIKNALTILILTGLCQMKDLVELVISNNMFSSKLPECLINLTRLKVL